MTGLNEISFGQLNILFFVAGAFLNTVLCWTRWRNIRSPVDVCILMICLSSWVTVVLDLFVGVHNTYSLSSKDESSPFYSFEFVQLWGFIKVTNWEWIAALMALLPFSNIVIKSRLKTFLLGAAWLLVEIVLLSIPMMHGTEFKTFDGYPSPILDYRPLVGDDVQSPAFLSWFFLVELMPYMYFILVTMVLLLVNCINYSNMRQGYITHTNDHIQDTKIVIAYSVFYLLSEIPGTMFYVIFTWSILFDRQHTCINMIKFGSFCHMFHLFLSTARCALIPMVFLITRYGLKGIFTRPVKFILDRCQAKVRYRRFHGEPNISLTEIEDNEQEL